MAARACLKNHSRHLHAPLCGIFVPNSLNAAHCAAFIWPKSPTKRNAHLAESIFQTRSRVSSDTFWKRRRFCVGRKGQHVLFRKFLREFSVKGRTHGSVFVHLVAAWSPSRHGIPLSRLRARLARSNKKPPASASGSIVTIFCFILRCHSAADQETESEDNPVCRREHGQCTHPAHSHGRKPCNFHW